MSVDILKARGLAWIAAKHQVLVNSKRNGRGYYMHDVNDDHFGMLANTIRDLADEVERLKEDDWIRRELKLGGQVYTREAHKEIHRQLDKRNIEIRKLKAALRCQ